VNVSAVHHLFVFGAFYCRLFGESVAISMQALQTDFYDMDLPATSQTSK